MSKTYELTTIRDIYEKVPLDRIKDCCLELGEVLTQSRALTDAAKGVADLMGVDPAIQFPDPLVWVDDGEGHIQTTISSLEEGGPAVSVTSSVK
jgi:hypothetical protein